MNGQVTTGQDLGIWVIFDTCTQPDYYLDVHKLLALPKGWVLRYDYRRKYLDETAEEAIFGEGHQPNDALLVYAQAKSYSRGGAVPQGTIPQDMLWVGTRLGQVILIPAPDGERAYFDIRVGDYPPPEHSALTTIIRGLLSRDAVPYKKWVAVSSDRSAYEELRSNAGDSNWERTVETLATPPAQFIDDVFWRLAPPLVRGKPQSPTEEDRSRSSSTEEEAIFQVVTEYELYEGHECLLPVVSHTPPGAGLGGEERRYVDVATAGSRLKIVRGARVELRRYSQDAFRVRATRSEETGEASETVSVTTSPTRPTWPRGPELTLAFKIKKRKIRIAIGVVCVVAAGALGVASNASTGWTAVPLGGLAALAGLVAYLAFTAKLKV